MKKLMLTVVAGAVCAVFGSAYAQSNPNTSLSSDQGMKTPKQTDDNRMDIRAKGASNTQSGGGMSSSSATSGGTGATSGASGTDTGASDRGTRKGRRAARREKG